MVPASLWAELAFPALTVLAFCVWNHVRTMGTAGFMLMVPSFLVADDSRQAPDRPTTCLSGKNQQDGCSGNYDTPCSIALDLPFLAVGMDPAASWVSGV